MDERKEVMRGINTQSGNGYMADEQIITLYWNRNEQAIRETHVKYGDLLYHLAYNILHDRCDCEECQNDTYLGIWNAIPPSRPALFQAFITRIMRNIAINRYKEKQTKGRVPSELTVSLEELLTSLKDEEPFDCEDGQSELGQLINEFVHELNEKQQYIFIGRYYMADGVKTIAEEMAMTESGVYKELRRLREDFRMYLERNGMRV